MAELFIGKAAELKDGSRWIVSASSNEIGVFHQDGVFYAYSNYCPHRGGPACEGLMMRQVKDLIDAEHKTLVGQAFGDELHIVCPWHGYEFELRTGEFVGDRKIKLRRYQVIQRGGDLYLEL
jgi:nitrite reductase/ring-hydroxylating ferredoxin subunit